MIQISEHLSAARTHFRFGDNWASYASLIDEPSIDAAQDGLVKLFEPGEIRGKTFLDIGCGSGVHAAAATRLGVARVLAIDSDAQSIATTKAVLAKFAGGAQWSAAERSVFELDPKIDGVFDVVYSWGVLHHTGDMRSAIQKACAMARPGGLIALALYRTTTLDQFWTWEKQWYNAASAAAQKRARNAYFALLRLGLAAKGRSLRAYSESYRSRRGMDLVHDVHDWLGGYPYESILATQVDNIMQAAGFRKLRIFARRKAVGLFGSGCDEYVYRRLD